MRREEWGQAVVDGGKKGGGGETRIGLCTKRKIGPGLCRAAFPSPPTFFWSVGGKLPLCWSLYRKIGCETDSGRGRHADLPERTAFAKFSPRLFDSLPPGELM